MNTPYETSVFTLSIKGCLVTPSALTTPMTYRIYSADVV